jgi:hypothetical protein
MNKVLNQGIFNVVSGKVHLIVSNHVISPGYDIVQDNFLNRFLDRKILDILAETIIRLSSENLQLENL